ncbi:MAG TPA: hypothetical protein VKO42_02890 [Patescibacteria group bacterium]|nr:hypothetical protein [Patescibacteria group bacterium]
MPKKERYFIYGMILFMFLLSFYWLSFRPYMAKKECVQEAEQFSRSGGGVTFEGVYDHCILKKGLK